MVSNSAPKINLLSKKKIVFNEQQSLVLKAKKISGIVLIVYGIVMAAVVGVNVFTAQQVNKISLAQDQVKMVLAADTVLVSQYEQIVSKVGLISDLMNARQEVVSLWQRLQEMMPEGCSLTQFSIKEEVLLVGIHAPHMVLANKALDVIEPELPSFGASKTLVQISRADDASYRLDFELALKKGELN